jgi:hypothetical protein
MNELKPCPFCGGNMQEIYETGVGASVDSFYYKYIVFCDCGAMMSGTAHVRSAKEVDRKSVISDHAKRTWNRRK